MTRRHFLTMSALLGLSSFTLPRALRAETPRKVIVIGAGAAGLTAGYRLKQRGIDFTVLEATDAIGGRMKRNLSFTDFPLPMGAEWMHTSSDIFSQIAATPANEIKVKTVRYEPDDVYAYWDGATLTRSNIGVQADQKFINSSWFDFFADYIAPSVESAIKYQHVARAIDTSSAQVRVETTNEAVFSADAVIVTLPVKMLQGGQVSFTPPLPRRKAEAIKNVKVWEGFKAFVEFDAAFYPTYMDTEVRPAIAGHHAFYDAAYGQQTNRHILGLFAVGRGAEPYLGQSDARVTEMILEQLDEIFDGVATPGFHRIITQDWTNAPYIGGAYVNDHEDWQRVRELGRSVGSQLHFAGEAYTSGEDWGSVHNAARAAIAVVDRL